MVVVPKILVVDDHPLALEVTEEALASLAAEVVTQSDSRQALRIFEAEGPWHLAILDLMMPGIDGLGCLKRIKEVDPRTEVIILTGQMAVEPATEAIRLGAFDYLIKPAPAERLLHSVGRALERYRLLRAREELIGKLSEQIQARTRELDLIKSVAVTLGDALHPEALIEPTLTKIVELVGAEAGVILLVREESKELAVASAVGLPQGLVQELAQRPGRVGEGLAGWVAERGEPLFIPIRASHDPRVARESFRQAAVEAFLAVPLRTRSATLGVLCLMTFAAGGTRIAVPDVEFVAAAGHLVGSSLEVSRLLRRIDESQRRLQAIFDGISDGIAIVDRDFRILAANRGAAAISARPVHELVGRRCYEEFFKRQGPCDGCPTAQAFGTGRVASAVLTQAAADAAPRHYSLTSYPLASGNAEVDQAVEYIRDVTADRERERHLQSSEKLAAVGQLAAGVAHELGNALAIVSGAVQCLLADATAPAPPREYLEVIHRNVGAMDRIIRGLLSFARPSPPSLNLLDLTAGLEQACLLLKGELAKARIEVSRERWQQPLWALADGQQMEQVFLNLLLNALHAMPGGGTIALRTRLDGALGGATIEVSDTGNGIPREYLHRVFDPFFTTKEGGTGLGLSVSHRIVAAHGGKLSVESQEGRGTRVVLSLPPAPQPPAAASGKEGRR